MSQGEESDGAPATSNPRVEIEAVRALLVAVDRVWAALGARAEMGVKEIVTLETLHFTSPVSTQGIRERTGLSAGAVTALVDRFEDRQLARRIRPEDNRRTVVVELTPAGRELSEVLFGSLVTLVEQGTGDADLPAMDIRVRCLRYTAELFDRAAEMVTRAS